MKTINCAECNKDYTYEPPRGFADNRKYCLTCSAKKNAEFTGNPPNPGTLINEETTTETKDNGFHLTPEQCRSNALASAIETTREMQGNLQQTILDLAKIYEKYIVTGE